MGVDVFKPEALKKGDTIAIVAPSGPVRGDSLKRGVHLFEKIGLRVKLGDSVLQQWGYLAGKDRERALDFMRAWEDPEVKGVIAARGGYGAMRILPLLDFESIRKTPKVLMGYSDITALHLALWKEARLVTFHGPVAEVWSPEMEAYSFQCVKDTLMGIWPPGDLPLPESPDDAGSKPRSFSIIEEGRASGRLIGGNLSLIASTIGTPWEVDTRGCILFLEEVGEKPYRIDRMLCQLRLAGKLEDAEGFCIGDFTDCEGDPDSHIPSFSCSDVLQQYFGHTGKPCLANVPAGHGKYNAVLPLGIRVEIEANPDLSNSGRITFLEKAVI